MNVIKQVFPLAFWDDMDIVKQYDKKILTDEIDVLFPHVKNKLELFFTTPENRLNVELKLLDPRTAEIEFLNLYGFLNKKIHETENNK